MNRYETENKWEAVVGLSLAVAGIVIMWSSALAITAKYPTQHSGTQTMERVK